jgi:hypothetical protein
MANDLCPLADRIRTLAGELYVAEQMRAMGGDEKEVQRLVREMGRLMREIERSAQ